MADDCGKTPLHFHLKAFYKKRKKCIDDESAQPMKKKLQAEAASVELCIEDSKAFTCRCSCQGKFFTFIQPREHEKLCWLKLPYGSIWTCENCGVQMSLLSYSSIIHHEGECNPFATLQSGIFGQPPFEVVPFMQNVNIVSKDAPICCCAHQPTYCITSVSRSERNPGRKYF